MTKNDPHNLECKIIIVGVGGQGVVFLTRLIAQTAMAIGYPVLVSETHGMSQRGGSVISHVKIGTQLAPLIMKGTANILLALDMNEALRNLTFLRQGGIAFINSDERFNPEVKLHLDRLSIQVACLSAGKIALDLGSPSVTNVLLAGYACAYPSFPFPIDRLRETVENSVSRGLDLNLKALAIGYQVGQDGTI